MAFVRSPDLHSIELLQKGPAETARRAVDVDAQHRTLVRGFRLRVLEPIITFRVLHAYEIMEADMGRGVLLWLLGVPIPVIILLWLFFGR
jgi:hypothetical protein